jgi:hypothetical protein
MFESSRLAFTVDAVTKLGILLKELIITHFNHENLDARIFTTMLYDCIYRIYARDQQDIVWLLNHNRHDIVEICMILATDLPNSDIDFLVVHAEGDVSLFGVGDILTVGEEHFLNLVK